MFRIIVLTFAVLLAGCEVGEKLRPIRYNITCDGLWTNVSTHYPDITPGFIQVYYPDRSTQFISTEGCHVIDVKRIRRS